MADEAEGDLLAGTEETTETSTTDKSSIRNTGVPAAAISPGSRSRSLTRPLMGALTTESARSLAAIVSAERAC